MSSKMEWTQNEAREWNTNSHYSNYSDRTGVKDLTSLPNTSLLEAHVVHLVWKKFFKYSSASKHHRMVWVGRASQLPALLLKDWRDWRSPLKQQPGSSMKFYQDIILILTIWQYTAEWKSSKWGKTRAELLTEMKIVITNTPEVVRKL